MIALLEKRPILTIVLLVSILLLPHLEVPKITIMESRNFITAREMVTDGNWLLPTMNGEPRYQKPPLPTWITAIFAMIFGMKSIWGLRLPSVLMLMLLGVLGYMLSRKLKLPKNQSLQNGLITITSLYIVAIIFEAPWDIYAHGFMLLGIYLLVQFFQSTRINWGIVFFIALCMGCSMMSKGPVSLYALFLPFIISYGCIFKINELKKKIVPCIVIMIIAFGIGVWWYAYTRSVDPIAFEGITVRETQKWTSYNVRPFYYYWSFFIQSGVWTIPAFIGLLYPYLKTRVSNLKVYKFTLLWALVAVILLSIIPEKKSRYLMPVLIPLALNTGFYIEYVIKKFKTLKDVRETIPIYFNFGLIALLFIGLGITLLFINQFQNKLFWVVTTLVSMVFSGVLMVLKLRKKNGKAVFYILFLGFCVGTLFGAPLKKNLITENYNTFSEEHMSLPIYSLEGVSTEVIWAYGKKIPQYKKENLSEISEVTFLLLGHHSLLQEIEEKFPNYTILEMPSIDLNPVTQEDEWYRKRLMSTLYKLQRK